MGSIVYRKVIFPFVRMRMERKTGSIIERGTYLFRGTTLEGKNYIREYAMLDNVRVGYSTMISQHARMSNTRIGKYCCIGNVWTYLGKHPVSGENISTFPAFYSTAAQFGYTYVKENSFNECEWIDEKERIQVEIGNDVWIGFGVAICEGVTIGDGAVIGAGSLVTKNVEPYAIYAGVPAKKIRMRFDDETIDKLLKLRWWDKGEAWIQEHVDKFRNPGEFISNVDID